MSVEFFASLGARLAEVFSLFWVRLMVVELLRVLASQILPVASHDSDHFLIEDRGRKLFSGDTLDDLQLQDSLIGVFCFRKTDIEGAHSVRRPSDRF